MDREMHRQLGPADLIGRNCLLVLLIIINFTICAAADEVWVTATGVDETGRGTAADPYVCASATTFDALMHGWRARIPAGSTIRLMRGLFFTKGSIPLMNGWKMRGSGIDDTIIRETSMAGLPPGIIWVLGSSGDYRNDGIEISDLTVDCNLQNQTGIRAIGAVLLQGSGTKISRVKAVGWGSTSGGPECFTFLITASAKFPAETNCLIEDCIIEKPAPNAKNGDGFSIWGQPTNNLDIGGGGWIIGAEIRGCRADTLGRCDFIAAGFGPGDYGATIDKNVFIGIDGHTSAFWDSCGSVINLNIRNNQFKNVNTGIVFPFADGCGDLNTKSLKSNIIIAGNLITIRRGQGGNPSGILISGFEGQVAKNITIERNIVRGESGTRPGGFTALTAVYVNNVTIRDNILDGNGGTDLYFGTNASGFRVSNNRNLAGSMVTGRNAR